MSSLLRPDGLSDLKWILQRLVVRLVEMAAEPHCPLYRGRYLHRYGLPGHGHYCWAVTDEVADPMTWALPFAGGKSDGEMEQAPVLAKA